MTDGWIIDVAGRTACCDEELSLEREPGTSPEVMLEEFGCPYCGSLLRIGRGTGEPRFELAAPCEICDLNGVPTEGPICVHCARCELDCDGQEYPEDQPEAHEFEPMPETN